MARSYKKAILKDRPRNYKKSTLYWRTVRSTINHYVKRIMKGEDIEIPNPKTIVNDYDYCDYIFTWEWDNWKKRYPMRLSERDKYRRK